MSGFFSQEKLNSAGSKGKGCASCGLYKNCKSPKMKPYGSFEKGIMILGEAPGQTEDDKGKPFVGKAGRMIKRTLKKYGIDMFKDCVILNAINCRPPSNATPSGFQIDSCRNVIVDRTIKEYKPNLIILLGGSAIQSLIGYRWKRKLGGINKWRGFVIPDLDYNAWLASMFHPSFVMRGYEEVETVFNQDIERALKYVNEYFPQYQNKIRYLNDLSPLRDINTDLIAFDYEATGLKPHAPGHRIVIASVATSENDVYTFVMPKKRKDQRPFLELLDSWRISKMAHNIKYERHWSRVRLKQEVNSFDFDSMLAAHILDNRLGVANLKFQTYVNFGVVDYDSEISPYLESQDSKDGNSFNYVLDLMKSYEGRQKLLKYCALDSLYEYRLAMKQMRIMNYDFLPF